MWRFDFVDVRDLAPAFVLGLKKEEAGGEQFIIRGGGATWQDPVIAVRQCSYTIPPEDESYLKAEDAFYPRSYVAEKSIRMLGTQYLKT